MTTKATNKMLLQKRCVIFDYEKDAKCGAPAVVFCTIDNEGLYDSFEWTEGIRCYCKLHWEYRKNLTEINEDEFDSILLMEV